MSNTLNNFLSSYVSFQWTPTTGQRTLATVRPRPTRLAPVAPRPLYTPEERRRRDESPWTLVQGLLAPLQFLVFLVSCALVLRTLATGAGYEAATVSILVKVVLLYTIMVTGSVWEKEVFGRYLFAPAFLWEDLISFLVLALHTAYVAALLTGALSPGSLLLLALAAYASYLVNAAQFVVKMRAARRELPVPAAFLSAR